jgi:predicted RNase H-like HicB family nuclease
MTVKKTLEYYLALPYPIVLIADPEDGTWYAKIPDLTGCMADGNTPAEALAALEEVKALWLEVSLEHKHDIPEPMFVDPGMVEIRQRPDLQQA